MMERWSLTDIQAEAILNMRLRALRKLEEIRDPQGVRRADRGEGARSRRCSPPTPSSGRRSRWRDRARSAKKFAEADRARQAPHASSPMRPKHDVEAIQQAMIEKEPVTVVISEKGWIRAHEGPSRRHVRR